MGPPVRTPGKETVKERLAKALESAKTREGMFPSDIYFCLYDGIELIYNIEVIDRV